MFEHLYIPSPRPALGTPTTDPVTFAAWRLRAVRRISASAARTATCIVSSGVPRCIDYAPSVRATTIATLCSRPRVRPT